MKEQYTRLFGTSKLNPTLPTELIFETLIAIILNIIVSLFEFYQNTEKMGCIWLQGYLQHRTVF